MDACTPLRQSTAARTTAWDEDELCQSKLYLGQLVTACRMMSEVSSNRLPTLKQRHASLVVERLVLPTQQLARPMSHVQACCKGYILQEVITTTRNTVSLIQCLCNEQNIFAPLDSYLTSRGRYPSCKHSKDKRK